MRWNGHGQTLADRMKILSLEDAVLMACTYHSVSTNTAVLRVEILAQKLLGSLLSNKGHIGWADTQQCRWTDK